MTRFNISFLLVVRKQALDTWICCQNDIKGKIPFFLIKEKCDSLVGALMNYIEVSI